MDGVNAFPIYTYTLVGKGIVVGYCPHHQHPTPDRTDLLLGLDGLDADPAPHPAAAGACLRCRWPADGSVRSEGGVWERVRSIENGDRERRGRMSHRVSTICLPAPPKFPGPWLHAPSISINRLTGPSLCHHMGQAPRGSEPNPASGASESAAGGNGSNGQPSGIGAHMAFLAAPGGSGGGRALRPLLLQQLQRGSTARAAVMGARRPIVTWPKQQPSGQQQVSRLLLQGRPSSSPASAPAHPSRWWQPQQQGGSRHGFSSSSSGGSGGSGAGRAQSTCIGDDD